MLLLVVSVWAGDRKSASTEFRLESPVRLSEAMQEMWRWAEFGKEDGLPSPEIVQIVESDDGTVWVWGLGNVSGGVTRGVNEYRPLQIAGISDAAQVVSGYLGVVYVRTNAGQVPQELV